MADLTDIKVPDIGDFTDIEVIGILVSVGDDIEAEQALLELESDKATLEVPSPSSGRVTSIEVSVGDKVSEGDLILKLELAEASETTPPVEQQSASQTEQPSIESRSTDAASPKSSGEADSSTESASDVTSTQSSRPVEPPVSHDASTRRPNGDVPNASPSVRKLARELGVPIGEVTGSGRKGRITDVDVKGFVKQVMHRKGSGQPLGQSGSGLNLMDWPTVDYSSFGPVELLPLSRIQKISGANLSRNWVMIPHVTQHDECDITEMEEFRKAHREEAKSRGFNLTPLAFLIKACVRALREFPNFNASLDPGSEQLVLKQYFHIGVAVDTPDGLVVPVLRNCDQKSVFELAEELADISVRARDRKLSPKDMQGGCFSISSLGGIGGTAFTPIINAPEVAILGVSRHANKPVWDGNSFVPRLMLPLSISYDHRVIDGASAARFTGYLGHVLSDIRRLLL